MYRALESESRRHFILICNVMVPKPPRPRSLVSFTRGPHIGKYGHKTEPLKVSMETWLCLKRQMLMGADMGLLSAI